MEKIVTAMLLMLVKAWTTVDTIGSDFKPNVDKKKYKDSVMECFEKIKLGSFNIWQHIKMKIELKELIM